MGTSPSAVTGLMGWIRRVRHSEILHVNWVVSFFLFHLINIPVTSSTDIDVQV